MNGQITPTKIWKAQVAIITSTLAFLVGMHLLDQRVIDVENEQIQLRQDAIERQQQETRRTLVKAALASCERGNSIRVVVYDLALGFDKIDDGPGANNALEELRDQPYVNKKTGAVNCRLAVIRPRPNASR